MGLSPDSLAQPQHWPLSSRHQVQPQLGLGGRARGPPPSPELGWGRWAGLATLWGTQACYPVGITVSDVVRGEEHSVLDEVGQGTQDEGHKKVHVDVVASAVEPPGGRECGATGG